MSSFLLPLNILKVLMFIALIIVGLYVVYAMTVLMWQPPRTLKKHEAIIVLTGDEGRIGSAFKLLLEGKAPVLLISGVESRIPFQELVEVNSRELSEEEKGAILGHCCIILDYVADTTETNAAESRKWISRNHIKNFILVTSAEHMPRAFLQFHLHLDDGVKITAYPYRDKSSFLMMQDKNFWYYTAREYIKFYGSLLQSINKTNAIRSPENPL